MKQKAANRKIELRFMDISIKLEGNFKSIDQRAYSLLSVLVADRLKFEEISNELGIDEEDVPGQKKSKKLQFDSMFQ